MNCIHSLCSERVTCFQYAVEKGGVTIAQSIDINVLLSLIQNFQTSSGDLFKLVIETDDAVFIRETVAFSASFSISVGSVDIPSLVNALALAWQTKLGFAVDVKFIWQEELFDPNG